MDFFKTEAKDVIIELQSDEIQGLSSSEAVLRQQKYGLNSFTKKEGESLLQKVLGNLREPLILILIVSGIISLIMGEIPDGLGIFAAVIIATTIAVVQEGRSDKAFETLSLQSENNNVRVVRDGSVLYVPKDEITIGDIIHIETGDKVPADARILHSSSFWVNESMLTGESKEVSKTSHIVNLEKAALSECKNIVYSGTFVVEGRSIAIVTAIGDKTEIGKIAEELRVYDNSQTPLQQKLADLGKKISIVGSLAALVIFLFTLVQMYLADPTILSHIGTAWKGIKEAFVVSVALIVAAVPEGLPTMVALTLAFNMQKMAKNNALVRKLIACETIGSVNIICSDKTGTLTQNKMTVMDIWCDGAHVPINELSCEVMLQNICLNSSADLCKKDRTYEFIGNPTECSLLVCAEKNMVSYLNLRNKHPEAACEINFNSARKMMTSSFTIDGCYRNFTKGSPEKILAICNRILFKGEIIPITASHKKEIEDRIKSLQDNAKRVLAFCYNDTDVEPKSDECNLVERDMIYIGFVGIEDPLREDVKAAIDRCRNAGIKVKILTGDNLNTATAIANQLGIIEKGSLSLEAIDVEKMSDDELKSKLNDVVLIARSNPTTKMRVVNLLKEMNNSIVVTGDGINDAPALKAADVGVAMGISGTEVAKEAAEIVLLDDSFSTIVKAVKWGRGIYENFQRFIQFQLTVNVVAFGTAIVAKIMGHELPFTTLQLLWVNIIMDGPPALSLGLEPPREHLMEQKPVVRNASIVTKEMLSKILLNGFFIVVALLYLINTNFLGGSSKEEFSTIVFTTFVIFQLWNSFNCRELNSTSVFANIHRNKVMLFIILVTFLIQIAVTQYGGTVFRTVPLSLDIWIRIIAYSFSIIVFNELVSLIKYIFKLVKQ